MTEAERLDLLEKVLEDTLKTLYPQAIGETKVKLYNALVLLREKGSKKKQD